jgi:hypothetical protein
MMEGMGAGIRSSRRKYHNGVYDGAIEARCKEEITEAVALTEPAPPPVVRGTIFLKFVVRISAEEAS